MLTNELKEQLGVFKLNFLIENLDDFIIKADESAEKAVQWWLNNEQKELIRKRFERRMNEASLGMFKPMSEFDWDWPEDYDKRILRHVLNGDYLKRKENVILIGPEGVGKTMIAKNLAKNAIENGHKAKFVNASKLVSDLGVHPAGIFKEKSFMRYVRPEVLVIDEIGYVNYDQSSAIDLFEIISRRYENASTIVTTNFGYADWGKCFPDSACAASLVDRLVHHSHTLNIKGNSFRNKERQDKEKILNDELKNKK